MPIRPVRFRESFFHDLDAQLPADRTATGLPSATDFLLYNLPRLRDLLAIDFEGNTRPVEGAEPIRVLVQAGTLVHGVALYGLTTPDGTVDVIAVDIDLPTSEAED